MCLACPDESHRPAELTSRRQARSARGRHGSSEPPSLPRLPGGNARLLNQFRFSTLKVTLNRPCALGQRAKLALELLSPIFESVQTVEVAPHLLNRRCALDVYQRYRLLGFAGHRHRWQFRGLDEDRVVARLQFVQAAFKFAPTDLRGGPGDRDPIWDRRNLLHVVNDPHECSEAADHDARCVYRLPEFYERRGVLSNSKSVGPRGVLGLMCPRVLIATLVCLDGHRKRPGAVDGSELPRYVIEPVRAPVEPQKNPNVSRPLRYVTHSTTLALWAVPRRVPV